MENLAENITNLRKSNNMSQDELASLLKVSRQAISKWERSEGLPDLYNVKKLAEVFNISVDYLIGNTNPNYIREKEISNLITKVMYGILASFITTVALIQILGLIPASFWLIYALFNSGYEWASVIIIVYLTLLVILGFGFGYTLRNLFINKELEKTKIISIILTSILLIGYLSILIAFRLSGFSIIFLYIFVLLLIITSIVGAALMKTNLPYIPNTNIERYGNFLVKYTKYIIIGFATIAITTTLGHLLIKTRVHYLYEMDFSAIQSIENDDVLLSGYYILSDEDVSYYHFDEEIYFTVTLPEGEISNPKVRIYVGDVIIATGSLSKELENTYILHQTNMNKEIDVDMEEGEIEWIKNIEMMRYEVTVTIDGQEEIISSYLMFDSASSSGSYATIWIWDKK